MSKKAQVTKAVELCLAIYRVTDLFPEDEVLKARVRALSLDVVEALIGFFKSHDSTSDSRVFYWSKVEDSIITMDFLLTVAGEQGWADKRNFEVLQAEYQSMQDVIKSQAEDGVDGSMNIDIKETKERNKGAKNLQGRAEEADTRAILKYLQQMSTDVTVTDISKALKKSKKTASRRLNKLIETGLVRKSGSTRDARFSYIK